MFSKETQALAKPCYEAIKKIAERQEKECPECKGMGLDLPDPKTLDVGMRVPACPTCSGTGKVKWEWEPQRGEFAQIGMGMIILVDRDGLFENKFVETSDMGLVEKDRLTPFLDWERIKEILEGMGYRLTVGVDPEVKPFKTGFECWIGTQENAQKYEQFVYLKGIKTRQEAVMRAVIELGKESSNEKD